MGSARFFYKTMRLLNTMERGNIDSGGGDEGGCKPLVSSDSNFKTNVVDDSIDWVGFNTPVKLVSFSEMGNYLAAMGGSSILIISLVGFDYNPMLPLFAEYMVKPRMMDVMEHASGSVPLCGRLLMKRQYFLRWMSNRWYIYSV